MRRQDREVLQPEQIDAILESCDCLRLGLNAEDGAYIVPLNFAYVRGSREILFPQRKRGKKGRHDRAGCEGGLRSSTARTGSAKRKPAAGIPFSIRALLERERSVRWKRWRKRSGHFLPLWHTIVRTARFLLPTSRRTLSRSSA